MNNQTKNANRKKFLIILTALLAVVITVLFSSFVIFDELEEQLQQNLEDVATQNALALHQKIHSNYDLLLSLSQNMHGVTPDTIEERLASFEIFIDEYDLKRFAYCFPDGTSYSTDGGVAELSYREFFQRGMQGKGTITGILVDALEEHHDLVNVMTIPIFDEDGQVEGVFGLTYNSENFNSALQISSFKGQGNSYAMNDDGQILVAMDNDMLQLSDNLFEDALKDDSRNSKAITNLKKQIETKSSGGGIFYLKEKYYYHCLPVVLMHGDMTWYMLTIIPAEVLESRTSPVQHSLYGMAFIVTICLLIGVAFLFNISKVQKNMMLSFAYEDPITKGANYAKFRAELNKKRDPQGFIISMDIVNFNSINIAAGKAAGDLMLCDVWKILRQELQGDELACHVQEDVFSMYLKAKDRVMLISRLNHISEQIDMHAKELQIKGIHSRYGIYEMQKNENLEDAYSKALIAREQVRAQRNQVFAFYDEQDHERLKQNHQLEEQFEESLADGDFEVWYQPKYSVTSEKIVGSEALVRWRNKDGSMISPGRFIPLFEQNGMIAKLDEYMFRAVCKQQAKWLAEGRDISPVSINLSRASLYYVDIVEKYKSIIQEYGISPDYVQLEITESAIQGMISIQELLEQFRNMGVRILMDDFGTGYSSLATLNMQCFDTLKLDKSLIDHIGDTNGEILLCYVISMGQKLGLHITAEGVETKLQLDFLKENHCDDIQGFLFAKPMPSEQFGQMLHNNQE